MELELNAPKAWFMAIGAFSTYVPSSSGWMIIAFAVTLFAIIRFTLRGCMDAARVQPATRVQTTNNAFILSETMTSDNKSEIICLLVK